MAPVLASSLVTVLLPLFDTQMFVPSKATPAAWTPTEKVPSVAPSLARSLVTLLLPLFATQMFAPSKARASGWAPTVKVPRTAPVLARSLVTLLLLILATQMLAPSKATAMGLVPTTKVPRLIPSFGRSLLTLLLPLLATQRLTPSKAMPYGCVPTVTCVVWLALYQCNKATCRGFRFELTMLGGCPVAGPLSSCECATMETTPTNRSRRIVATADLLVRRSHGITTGDFFILSSSTSSVRNRYLMDCERDQQRRFRCFLHVKFCRVAAMCAALRTPCVVPGEAMTLDCPLGGSCHRVIKKMQNLLDKSSFARVHTGRIPTTAN